MEDTFDSDSPSMIAIKDFSQTHGDIIRQAIENVLSSPAAKLTYGQIIDGMLLSESALDVYSGRRFPGHPLSENHLELSNQVLEHVEDLRNTFKADEITLPSPVSNWDTHMKNSSQQEDCTNKANQYRLQLAQQFRSAALGSRAFNTRLIEIVARVIHHIATTLYEQGHMRQDDDPLMKWRPSDLPNPKIYRWAYRNGFPPTFFYHEWYTAYDQYPHGVADTVGYWAENTILGGVVLFDRREPGSVPGVDPNAIYFHTDARDVTYRIYRLLDTQKRDLVDFLMSSPSDNTETVVCPLPIHADTKNRIRVDPEESMKETGIYRDKWERELPSLDRPDARFRDVIDTTFDYLSRDEFMEAAMRARIMKFRLYDGEDLGWTSEE